MEFMNLKERIKSRSTFSFEKVNERIVVGIECIDTKYSVTFSTEYQNVGNIDIELKNLLINGLIEIEGFVNKLGKVENREKNLDILL